MDIFSTEVLKICRIHQCSTMHHVLSVKDEGKSLSSEGDERTKITPNAVVALSARDEAIESTLSAAITLPTRDENINQAQRGLCLPCKC